MVELFVEYPGRRGFMVRNPVYDESNNTLTFNVSGVVEITPNQDLRGFTILAEVATKKAPGVASTEGRS